MTGLDFLFWAAGFGEHVLLLLILFIRRRFKVFPVFTALIASNVARTIALYFVLRYASRASYFYSFWSFGILDTILQLLVVYELYALTFRPLGPWARDVRGLLVPWVVTAVAVASGLTWLATPHARLWMQIIVIKGNFFSSACMSEFLVGIVVLAVKVGLPWRTHVARISQGLGAYSLIDVLIEAGHNYSGVDPPTYTTLSHLRMTSYLVCAAFWIVKLWRNAPDSRSLPESLRGQLLELQNMADSDLEKIRARWI